MQGLQLSYSGYVHPTVIEISRASSIVVLVVEDDLLIRMGVVATIEDAGIAVVEATNADEAIALLESRPDITVVFTDIEMPGSIDGLELAFAVRGRWPPITLIVASGRIPPRPDEMPSETTFLRKPYTEASVIEAVRRTA
jgi:CheY-like chemotaxis protein